MRWSIAGAVAGLVMIAAMLVLRVLTGVPALPELIEDQVIALVPGSVFGLVLDRLQFAAKPLLLVGLAALALPLGAGLGWLYARAWPWRGPFNRRRVAAGLAYGLLVWLVFEFVVAAWGDGVAAALASAGLLFASAEIYGVSLVCLARLLTPADGVQPGAVVVDRARRLIVFGGLTGGALALVGGSMARMLTSANTEQPAFESAQTEAGLTVAASDEASPTAEEPPGVSRASAPITIPPGVSDEITPNDRFYIISKNFNDPRVSADKWSLEVFGLVAQPVRLSYAEVLALPNANQYTTLECISNTLGGKLMSNAYWTGVPLAHLLGSVVIQPGAQAVIFRSADNYYESFPLELALSPGVLLAHTINGAPLPDRHGFPLRLIMPGRYGVKNPKWITKIEVSAEPIEGYWVRRGWDREALVQTVARIDTPVSNASVVGPRLEVGGVAFAGSRGISRVEASLDGGTTWREARIRPPLGSSTWVQWASHWDDVTPGTYTVLGRAADGTGALQTAEESDPFSSGATGYHRVRINIAASG